MRSLPSTQRGAAYLIFVAVLSAVVMLVVIGQLTWQARHATNTLPQVRAERVTRAAELIRVWYETNAAALDDPDRTPFPPSGETVLAEAGVPKQWGLSAAVSQLLTRDRVRYRVIAIWAPSDDGKEPVFDGARGTLNVCPEAPCSERVWALVEGYRIQVELYEATVKNLRSLALAAQAFFHSKWLADPNHDLAANYFRDPNETTSSEDCTERADKFGCYDGWVELDDTNVLQVLQEPAARGFDAWGNVVYVANGGTPDGLSFAEADWQKPPFRLAFSAVPPWAQTPEDRIIMVAIQRL